MIVLSASELRTELALQAHRCWPRLLVRGLLEESRVGRSSWPIVILEVSRAGQSTWFVAFGESVVPAEVWRSFSTRVVPVVYPVE